MFLEKINNFPEESLRLKKIYSSKCDICNGSGLIKKENGCVTCNCIKKANIQARLICNGLPKKYVNISWANIPNVENDQLIIDSAIFKKSFLLFCSNNSSINALNSPSLKNFSVLN